jgi:hypothetical protein
VSVAVRQRQTSRVADHNPTRVIVDVALNRQRSGYWALGDSSGSLCSLPVANPCTQLTESELGDVVGGSDRALLWRLERCEL